MKYSCHKWYYAKTPDDVSPGVFSFFVQLVCNGIEEGGDGDDEADHNENTEHTFPEIREVFDKLTGVKIQ